MKDPVEIRLPACNRFLVCPGVEEPRDSVSPALFGDLFLHFCDGPAIENIVGAGTRRVSRRVNSRFQLIDGIAHGPAEIVQLSFVDSPFNGAADIGARKPELNIDFFVDHRVLAMCELGMAYRRM